MEKQLFNFADMANSGQQTASIIAREFEKNGAALAGDPVIDPRPKRTAGIPYREVTLLFKDSQKILLRVKQSGDVYQVLLNGRDLPIKNQDDQEAAISEMVDALNAKRKAFQKRLTALRVPLKERGLTVTKRMLANKLKARALNLTEMIAEAQEEYAGLVGTTDSAVNDPEKKVDADDDKGSAAAEQLEQQLNQDDPNAKKLDDANDAELAWLTSVAAGTLDDCGDLSAAIERVRAAQGNEAFRKVAEQAAGVLTEAVAKQAQQILDSAANAEKEKNDTVVREALVDAARVLNRSFDDATTEAASEVLKQALAVVENNRPINEAAGNTEQAELEAKNAESFRAALEILSREEAANTAKASLDDAAEEQEAQRLEEARKAAYETLKAAAEAYHAADMGDEDFDAKALALYDALGGGAREVLGQLVNGPVYDGDVVSKSDRDTLLEFKLANKVCFKGETGYNGANYDGYYVWKAGNPTMDCAAPPEDGFMGGADVSLDAS